MNKTDTVFVWMLFLLATNTAVIVTLLRERIVFRRIRDEIARFLPAGYDPKRLDYPYLFGFTTPPAWAEALAAHRDQSPGHSARGSWERFRAIRGFLMLVEVALVVGFALWMALG
jgi:hypothetical protein